MGGRSVRKGKVGEREVVALLRDVFPEAGRSYHQAHLGSKACDVEGTPLWIEAKCEARPSPMAALAQALGKAEEVGDARPVVAFTVARSRQRRGEPWLATMRAEDLIALLREVMAYRTAVSIEVGEGGGGPAEDRRVSQLEGVVRRAIEEDVW